MHEYHKIQTVFKRDPNNNYKTLLEWDYSLPEFGYLANNEWVFTEKVDGTNIRVGYNGSDNIYFAGKTDRANIPQELFIRLNDLFYSRLSILKELFSTDKVCLYGEGYGAKIQKDGWNYRQDQDFVLFDVKIGDWWLQRHDVEDIADQLNIDVVPIVGRGSLYHMVKMARQGFKSQWGDFAAEGIVARPLTELKTRSGHRIITKIKHRDFHN